MKKVLQKDKELASKIRNNREQVETTYLTTDERVIARVTDGIYRQPGSALRELISNAYDADATKVIIRTDEPRFKTMSIEDNGHGMSPEALSYVLHHIGGSSKRNETGSVLGVTNNKNYNLSPNGRNLIGKIGIGLFSVAQLTQNFQIITKREKDEFRTVASVVLKQFSEKEQDDTNEYESGIVKIWTEKASDLDFHGTTIILNKIRPQSRETLSSKHIWDAVEGSQQESEENGSIPISPPKYHIGKMANSDNDELLTDLGNDTFTSRPWMDNDSPEIAFEKLVQCVWSEDKASNPKPKISDLFDYYLKMVWDIALAIPTGYVKSDIFSIPYHDQFYPYLISNSPKGQATALELKEGQSLKDVLGYSLANEDKFDVFIDDLKLSRPIIFENLPASTHSISKPMVFIGKFEEYFGDRPRDITGGPLRFKAYLFWNSKISPVEHQGALIRIHNASGTLFDETFMKYQVQETTRKRQVTCEIFIEEGLDSALNIDRESYNFSHPHVVILTRWLHSAFRQLTNSNKSLAQKLRERNRDVKSNEIKGQINKIVQRAWIDSGNDIYQSPPKIEIRNRTNDENESTKETSNKTEYVIDFSSSIKRNEARTGSQGNKKLNPLSEDKLKAITAILASFGALDNVPEIKRNEMIFAIYEIINAED
ncbi:ATP-binding protein [Serratia fonticola]